MKLRYLIVFSVLFWVMGVSAQDVITKTDGSKIDAKVEEITETTIRYRNATNPTGPIYNIPISTVANILYQNGTIDNFTSVPNVVLPAYTNSQPSSVVSDAQLLRMAMMDVDDSSLYAKAKRYRKTGWIGGSVILGASIAAGVILWTIFPIYDDEGPVYFAACAGSGLGAAAIWWLCFHFSANSLVKKARAAEMYSVNIVENEIYRFGDKSLTAGINLMGNQMTRTRGLGLSLSLNF